MAVSGAPDDVGGGFAGTKDGVELLLDTGDVAVKDGFGFCTEGLQGILPKGRVVEAGFLFVDTSELLPVDEEVIGRDAFGVREEKPVKGALHWVENHIHILFRQEDDSPPMADDYGVSLSHDHKFPSEKRRFQTITSL